MTPEQSLVLFVVGLLLGIPAIFLMSAALFLVIVWVFVPVPH